MARKNKGPVVVSPAEEWARIAGGFVLVVLAGAGLWLVAPLGGYGAAVVMGLLAGAFPVRARGAVSAVMGALATGVVLSINLMVPGAGAGDITGGASLAVMLIAAAAAFGIAFARQSGVEREHLAWLVLAIVVVVFLYRAGDISSAMSQRLATEPPAEGFAFDPVLFEKTFYHMERGSNFYEAFGQAFADDSRFEEPTRDLAGWRSPTTFWLWNLLANRWSTVAHLFIALSAASLVGAYYVSWRAFKDPVAATVPAALLTPYYMFALGRYWFPELEFWAAFAALGSVAAMYAKREYLAIGLAFLAGAMREWLLSALVAGGAQRLLTRSWKRAALWLGGAAAVVAGYLVNAALVRNYLVSVGIEPQVGTAGRVGGGGPGFILYTARFCCDAMAHPLVIPWLALGAALVVAAILVVRSLNVYLPFMLLVPLGAFLLFGSGQGPLGETGWNDYYGAAYLPFAFILATGLADLPRILKKPPALASGRSAAPARAKG